MALIEPVFLLCSERSGSNLIRVMLNAHTQVFAPQPTHLARWFWNHIHRYGDLEQDANWHMLIRHIVRVNETWIGEIGVRFTEQDLIDGVPSRRFRDLYEFIYETGCNLAGGQRVVVKENHAHRFLYLLLDAFPDARFVLQVRDPRDFVASCQALGMHYGTHENAIRVWIDDQEGSLNALHALSAGSFFVLRYEDLVSVPEVVLKALCAFLGLPYEAAMLDYHKTKDAREAATKARYWENLAKPVIRDNTKKYEALGKSTIAMVERECGELMDRFGYRRDLPSHEAHKRGKATLGETLAGETRCLDRLVRLGYSHSQP